MVKLWLILASASYAFAAPTTYTLATPFDVGTATGVLGGTVTAATAFDGISTITVTLSDGTHTIATTITPVGTMSRWSLFAPSTPGAYTITGTHAGGSITTDPAALPITIGPIIPLASLQSQYMALKQGCTISYNTQSGYDYSGYYGGEWALGTVPINSFAPTTDMNAAIESWMVLADAAGCKYVQLTAKHIGGLALYPTQAHAPGQPIYSIAQTAWYAANGQMDIMDVFAKRARAHGLLVMLYYCLWDFHYEVASGTTMATGTAAYIQYIKDQFTELLTNYGNIVSVWSDGWGWAGNPTSPGDSGGGLGKYTYLQFSTMYNFIKVLQPNMLVVDNGHNHPMTQGDIEVWEVWAPTEGYPPSNNTTPCEASDTMRWDSRWFYSSATVTHDASQHRSARAISDTAALLSGRYCNYILNFNPGPDGLVPAGESAGPLAWRSEQRYATNLALGKTVTSSSVFPGYLTSFLTDGLYISGGYPGGSPSPPNPMLGTAVFSTNTGDTTPYAEVDLGSAQSVARVEVFNPNDYGGTASGMMRDITVLLYDASHTLVYTSALLNPENVMAGGIADYTHGPGQITVTLKPTSARYVRVTRTAQDTTTNTHYALRLQEITVYAGAPMLFPMPGAMGAVH